MADAPARDTRGFVIATGRQQSVRHFIELSAKALGWGKMHWEGSGLEETGRRGDTGEIVVRIDHVISAQPKWKPYLEIQPKPERNLAGRPSQPWRSL